MGPFDHRAHDEQEGRKAYIRRPQVLEEPGVAGEVAIVLTLSRGEIHGRLAFTP